MTERSISKIVTASQQLEGGGFPVRRPFPTQQLMDIDPFLLLDHMGPVDWGPGEAIGAPDHPHRGFETVTYMLQGEFQHKDSAGHQGNLLPGDVQWMTAGAGVVHSEMPSARIHKEGGTIEGLQLWVNLPAKNKVAAPRYQEIPGKQIPEAETKDGLVKVRIIAGEALGRHAVIDTHIPIIYLHYTIKPEGYHSQVLPKDQNAFIYIISGELEVNKSSNTISEGQLAMLGKGDTVSFGVNKNRSLPTSFIILAGEPLNESITRHGPFVMNTKRQIQQAIKDYHEGRMGKIDS